MEVLNRKNDGFPCDMWERPVLLLELGRKRSSPLYGHIFRQIFADAVCAVRRIRFNHQVSRACWPDCYSLDKYALAQTITYKIRRIVSPVKDKSLFRKERK